MMRPPRLPTRLLALVGLAAALGCDGLRGEPRWVGIPAVEAASQADRERYQRRSLEEGRALRHQGRQQAAERAFRRGLSAQPDHAGLQRELATVLEAQRRFEEADAARVRADALEPPPAPLVEAKLQTHGRRLLVILLPPAAGPSQRRLRESWPDGEVAETLERRLGKRLPGATIVHAEFATVRAARQWISQYAPDVVLSLRVDRLYCGDTVKDGRFGVASLQAGVARSGGSAPELAWGRALVRDPRAPDGCVPEATARALEHALELSLLQESLSAPRSAPGSLAASWSTQAIRSLFPDLGEAIDIELAEGHQLLGQGNVAAAAAAFRRAAHIDPNDPSVLNYLHEANSVLAMSRELSQRSGEDPNGLLDPRFTPAQRAAAETLLRDERRRRDDLLTALAVMDEDLRYPDLSILAQLRPVEIREPDAFGPTLARRRAGSEVEARSAYAPDGSIIARYYFPVGEPRPVLREEDTSNDGIPDRWIAYSGDTRSELWDDGRNAGRPDVRLVFAESGTPLLRIEIDQTGDGAPDRIFHYADGFLSTEARDTDGDGQLDTFDRFDDEGFIGVREEDLDGDGGIDIRSIYKRGKLIRRELSTSDARSRSSTSRPAHGALD